MSFGSFRGSLTGVNTVSATSHIASATVPCSIGDLAVVVFSEQTSLTVSSCTDNVHGTTSSYTAQNAGTLSTSVSGRMFYKVVTSSGSINNIVLNCTSSAHNFSGICSVFQGPFTSVPIDGNPANVQSLVSPFTSTATGALTSSNELVVGWASMATSVSASWATVAPGALCTSVDGTNTSIQTLMQSWVLTPGTSSLTAAWTGSVPTNSVIGVATFIASSTPDVVMGTMTL